MKIKKMIFSIFFLGVLLIVGVFVYARFIEPARLHEESIDISSPFLTKLQSNLTIGVISDTHFGEYYDLLDFQRALDSLAKNKPDMVVFTGDLFDDWRSFAGDSEAIAQSLASIEAPFGKYSIFGNHDYGGGGEIAYEEVMVAGGFQILRNEYLPLDDLSMSIIGIDDFMLGYGNIDKASWAREDYFNILLCHEPDIADQIKKYNIDLMISGHTHGGQIHLPIYSEKFLPPYGRNYVRGLYPLENHRYASLYVNPGLGTTKLPLRFRSVPEITYITLKKLPSR